MTATVAAKPAKQPKPLPAPNSDFYEVHGTLNAEKLATVKKVREFMEAKVAPVITKYWVNDAFPFDLLPDVKDLGIGLPRLVGKGRALQLILSAEMISAQEAYRIGLVNEIVLAADLLTRAEAILRKIASNAPMAVKFALTAVNKGLETSQDEGLLLEASYFGLCAGTEDKKEGTSAFLEKRPPQFHGR